MAAFLFNFFLISERDIFWNSSILIYIKLIKKNFEYFNHILNNLNNNLKYMNVKNNSKLFKVEVANTDNNYTSQCYYNCSICPYHTSNTFNFTRHLKQHPEELDKFLQTSFNNNQNIEIDYQEATKDTSQGKIENNNQQNYVNNMLIKNYESNNYNSWKLILRNIFNRDNHLNKYDVDLIKFYMHSNKSINKGSFSESFLGEDKFTGLKVIILKSILEYEEDINTEKYILNKINGAGNFPPFYDLMYDEDFIYLIEGHMGIDLKSLFRICDNSFDLPTTMKIGIDLITNLKILHDIGYVHRDLKPDNLAFGPLCPENIKYRNTIGILDLGNAKFLYRKNGTINYKKGKVRRCGNKYYASTNALLNKDTLPFDDIESIFYILIYFYKGELPWKKNIKGFKNITVDEIISIRNKVNPDELCKGFPAEFVQLYQKIINRNENDQPDYECIIQLFQKILNEKIKEIKNSNWKLKWINVIEIAIENKKNKINDARTRQVFELFERNGLILDKYLETLL